MMNFWNYIDLVPPLGIITISALFIFNDHTDVIEEKQLIEIGNCKLLLKQLTSALEEVDSSIEELAQGDSIPDLCNAEKFIEEKDSPAGLYERLKEEFEKETGLTLELGYHDVENGSSYDEVSGIYWAVGGIYEETKAYKDFKKKTKTEIRRAFFVTYG